jgi:outer membrane immunogenic protein
VKGGYTNSKLNVLAGDTNQSTDTSFKLDGWRVGTRLQPEYVRQAGISLFQI